MMQTKWKTALVPILRKPLNGMVILPGLALASGVNVINHKLGRMPQGWVVLDTNAAQTVYRSAPFNDLTLSLTASGAVTITLGVF
jgi:hypothetical protein